MINKFLECGIITGTHGIKGEMRVQPWCDTPEFLTKFKTLYFNGGEQSITVLNARANKTMVILKAQGVETIEQAEAYRNKVLYIDRNDANLPKDAVFVQDLLGCEVFDEATNEKLGEIVEVSKTGANDVWHIKKDGEIYLIPAIDDVIVSVDVEKSIAVIHIIKGMFGDED